MTPDQQQASDAFYRFLMSDETIFILSGGPGVGKTWLMGHLCDDVLSLYADSCRMLGREIQFKSVHFTATTNKAAEILEHSIKKPVQTIHSFLGLKVKEDYKTGKTDLIKTNNYEIKKNIILFIDEYSMIDTTMFKLIIDTLPYCKIIFVGDDNQMAPVDESKSPVMCAITPDNHAFLNQPVRNAGAQPLVDICNQLRQTVETGVFHPIKEVPGYIEYLDDAQMQQKLDQHFQDLDPSCRVLCYTNSRVKQFNDHIRQVVRGMPAEIQVGDTLVVAQNAQTTAGQTINVEREVYVTHIGPAMDTGLDPSIFEDGKELLYQEVKVRVLPFHKNDYVLRVPLENERWSIAVKYFARIKDWHNYFALKNKLADLRDKAACTVYKAQGSTYDFVFLDLGNIGTSFDAEQVARMLYVGFSRAKSKVYLYGQLPNKYTYPRTP